jgi:DNA helicase-2/ATP-dependent DNA helicase PcrA
MVSVMTLHSAKGLEFDHVFLPGWEEGLFPSQRSMDENGMSGLEEERRLAYVGITRARKRAVITFAANRQIYGSWTSCMPSRFIEELPKEHIEAVVDQGLYSGNSNPYASPYAAPRRPSLLDQSVPRTSSGGFSTGDKVFHEKFGAGLVLSVEQDKLDISFERVGRKKVIDSFVSKKE